MVKKGDLLFTIDQRPYQAAYDAAKSQVDVADEPARIHQDAARARRGAGQDPATYPSPRWMTAGANSWPRRPSIRARRRRCAHASLDLEFTEIKAPLAGRIDRRLVSVGNLVQPTRRC